MTTLEVANFALSLLGARSIADLDTPLGGGTDASAAAKLCSQFFPLARNAALEARPWTFATHRTSLSPDATAPVNRWAYRFQLPDDTIRVLTVEDVDGVRLDDWEVEGGDSESGVYRYVLADEATVYVRYIRRVDQTEAYPAAFCRVLSADLASMLAVPLSDSKSLRDELQQLRKLYLREAAASDGQQGRAPQRRWVGLASRRY